MKIVESMDSKDETLKKLRKEKKIIIKKEKIEQLNLC